MSGKTSIEWTDATWNPVRGCSRVSEGCRNCYAEGIAARFNKPGQAFEGLAVMKSDGPHWTGKVRLVEEHLNDPLRWKKPRRIFVNSMSDLFHEELPEDSIRAVFSVMASARQHTFQILTKRPARMMQLLTKWREQGMTLREGCGSVLPNVWLGVSVEDQKTANERIPLLVETPAAIRFLSCEPLLGPIDLDGTPAGNVTAVCESCGETGREEAGTPCEQCMGVGRIDWVIVGGESGRRARPMHPEWVREIRDLCEGSDVAFFFKQWGEYASEEREGAEVELSTLKSNQLVCAGRSESTHTLYTRVGKHVAGRKLDGIEHSAFPAMSL